MSFRNRNTQSRVLPRPPERRGVSSYMHMMESLLKNTSYPSESELKACTDPSSSILPHSGSPAAKRETYSPLSQHPIVVRSNLPVLKPNHVPVNPVNKQNFTNGPPEHQGVSSKVSVKNIIFPCEFESNASVDRSSSLQPHPGSRAVMADKLTPIHQHPIAVCSNLPVLKPKSVPVKPVNKQNFTDRYPEHQGVSLKVSVKNINYPPCESELKASVDRSSSYLEPISVPVVPVVGQRITYGPPKSQGVSSPKHKTGVSVKNISGPFCESGLNPSVELSLPVLPFLKPSCGPVKSLARQKLLAGQNKPTGYFSLTESEEKTSVSSETSCEHGGVKSSKNLIVVSGRNVNGRSCKSDLNASVDPSLPVLPCFGRPAVRVDKSQNPVAVPIHLPALTPSHTPVKLSAGQKLIDGAQGRQVSRFTTFVMNKAERNGTDPSIGSDLQVKSHLSLPRLPSLTGGPVKVDKRESVRGPMFRNKPALKPKQAPVQSAEDTQKRVGGVVTKNLILSQFDDEDVKIKRPQSA